MMIAVAQQSGLVSGSSSFGLINNKVVQVYICKAVVSFAKKSEQLLLGEW